MTIRLTAQTKVAADYYAIMEKVTAQAIEEAKATVTNNTDIGERREQVMTLCQGALCNFQTLMKEVINKYTPHTREWRYARMYSNAASKYCLTSKELPKIINEALESVNSK